MKRNGILYAVTAVAVLSLSSQVFARGGGMGQGNGSGGHSMTAMQQQSSGVCATQTGMQQRTMQQTTTQQRAMRQTMNGAGPHMNSGTMNTKNSTTPAATN